jgi:hypothetical protein
MIKGAELLMGLSLLISPSRNLSVKHLIGGARAPGRSTRKFGIAGYQRQGEDPRPSTNETQNCIECPKKISGHFEQIP